ncbi:MAG: hypothetical protein KF893_09060 [Caldilineaceae bacterium]|nr:hypothetical protein [Caldilineaceae bacterium]
MLENNRWRILLIGAFVVALVITSIFALRVGRRVEDFRRGGGPPPIAPWMNIPHVARMYHVPPQILYDALDLPPTETRPLAAIARAQGREVGAVIADLTQAIEEFSQMRAPPPDAPSPPSPGEGRS